MDQEKPSIIASLEQRRLGSSGLAKYLAVGVLICLAWFQFPRSQIWKFSRSFYCRSDASFDGKLEYRGESIAWEECGALTGRKLECSEINVPMDHFNPDASRKKTFTIPLIRLRGKNATQNIILNPGGPGGSGIEFIWRRGEQLNAIIGEGFHLLSFDPRGVNGSRPKATCYPNEETKRFRSQVRASKVIADSAEVYSWTQSFVRACADTMGEYASYINTPQTAADMNNILDAVGQKAMVYWGFSYGTILGQTYATLFPERSERVIIDGVANNFNWYETLIDNEKLADAENVLLGFFDECIKAGKNCPLSTLAESKEELQDKVLDFTDRLNEPLSVYVNKTVWGLISRENIIFNAIFSTLYKPANWYGLAERLAELLQGNATKAFLAYGIHGPWHGILAQDATISIRENDGASGPELWPQAREDLLDMITPWMNSSLFALLENGAIYSKQQWKIPKTHNFVPKYGVETAHPLLILSTSFDPICPLISARSAKAAFKGSEIVELKGYGHGSLAIPSNCVVKHVRAFLYNGTVPQKYTQCEVDGTYFVKPNEIGTAVTMLQFEDAEDERIYHAQLQIAQDESWPYIFRPND